MVRKPSTSKHLLHRSSQASNEAHDPLRPSTRIDQRVKYKRHATATKIPDYSHLTLLDLSKEKLDIPPVRGSTSGDPVTKSIVANGGYAIRSLFMAKGQAPAAEYSLDSSEFDAIGSQGEWEGILIREKRCFVWLAHLAYGKASTMNEAEIQEIKKQWQEHKDRLFAKPIKKKEDIDSKYLRAVSVNNPTSLAWVIKIALEIKEIMNETDVQGTEQNHVGKLFFGKNDLSKIRSSMCYKTPAIFYFGKAACPPCKEAISGKSWLTYYCRRELQAKRVCSLVLPCGQRGERVQGTLEFLPKQHVTTCFNCSKGSHCKIKSTMDGESGGV